MELHQLRYFVSVADHENFTRAAEKCFVAQPSLSQQIIKLEKELGGPLFDRTARKVRLTDAGRKFYQRAVLILGSVEAARQELLEEDGSGRIAIGAIPTLAPYLLPSLLKDFVQSYPEAEVSVYENLTQFTIQACLEGEIDVGFLALPVESAQLEVEPLFSEELLLAMSADHALAGQKRITMKHIMEEPFVLLSEAHCLGEQIVSFCKQSSCLPSVSCHSAQLLTVQEMVGLGHGVSLIPRMAADADRSDKRCYRSLSGKKPTRTIAMISRSHRHQTRLVREFMQQARASLRK
ncbi:MAG TPA: LysR substrate-binding domain-containing protein [Planctomycetaceae bacterium]|nr:LysR substrate-binding domain-containing protein [Planctomycetaceae bacterium]